MPRPSSDYAVSAQERFAALVPDWQEIGPNDVLEYRWDHGGERLTISHDAGGSSTYSGTYHPNDGMCETGSVDGSGVCYWCGATIWGAGSFDPAPSSEKSA